MLGSSRPHFFGWDFPASDTGNNDCAEECPFTVKAEKNLVLIENFQGERSARTARIHGQTKVTTKGDEIILTGPVLSEVSQTAAEIEQKTRIKNKDHRVFLDGIYISSKSKGIEK